MTNDKEKIKEAIKSIDVISVGGTAIGNSVVLATSVFKTSQETGKAKSIILLTDGQSNVGISVLDAANYAMEEGVVVYALGIATEEGGVFTEDLVVSQLDSDTLKDLASKTGGKFYLIGNLQELTDTYIDIFSSTEARIFFDTRVYLILAVFILLMFEWVLSNTRYKTII